MPEALILTLKLEREDNPLLYDDLRNLPKGIRRTNRLRTLATNGLNSEVAIKPIEQTSKQGGLAAPQGNAKAMDDVGTQAAVEVFGIAKDNGA